MSAIFEGRLSDSPYIEIVWRGHVEHDYSPVCPADVRWNLLLTRQNGKVRVSVEGPTTKSILKHNYEGSEFLVIKFKLGTFMPYLPVNNLVDADAILPEGAGKSFGLNGSMWQLPDYDNAEVFVDRLVREGLLIRDPVVNAVLQDQLPDLSSRTVRRRFLFATGLTRNSIGQIERAQQAATLLGQGVPILDVVYQAGYADQPHLTRSLKRFYGQTPAQIARVSQSE
ncbi:MAG: AraC family transcriptional regulator [Chloroflexota bacterium]